MSRALPPVAAIIGVVALVLSGCASDGRIKMAPVAAPATPSARHPALDPRLPVMPSAGSGRGGYYLDDGPGDNPPPGLYDVPDPIVKSELPSRYGNRPYVVFGKTYTPLGVDSTFSQRGVASWYGKKFHGQRTSSGEPYDMYQMSAAHPTLPIPSYARVTSLETGKSVVVRVNDRGPFHSSRIIDVSYTAALKLGLLGKGSHEVQVERLLPDDPARRASTRRNAPEPEALATMPRQPSSVQVAAFGEAAPSTLVSAPVAMAQVQTMAPAVVSSGSAGSTGSSSSTSSTSSISSTSSTSSAAGTGSAADGFYLQLGAFSQAANAAEARARVLATGVVSVVDIVQAGALHRLFGGPFASREEAQKAAAALPAGLAVKALVVRRTSTAPVN
ncbi:septal ring lytic transglycosylase RlpA family protein [Massilia sp. PWRC2]|uniref:septal ring lytic transglycosylase RlpA family protein n=1 Tax=Massilia sp. PWRC2 TaxID=2804626 RepID=UPI003CEFFD16